MTVLGKLNQFAKVLTTAAAFALYLCAGASPVAAQEITAVDFNGDLIGKVIPDGKVVSFDNQLVGNVTADSLIVNFDGELIGGVIPQGIAIGNDNKLLGKVSNDGSVRLSSGKIVGKVLPNGLVVDDYFSVLGTVLFPGLIYSDEGKTVGRLTGDGLYTNLQGQQIGFVSPDGYAYRKVGNDYILDGRLISSKMVVSLAGDFIGSVSPGGNITNFDAETIGFIKANGYAYNENNQIIGSIVKSGYAFDNAGKYLGFVTYNGEVIQKEGLIGRMRADGNIADTEGNIIGFAVDIAATASDLNGRYLGRIMPGGSIAKARENVGIVGPRGTVLDNDGKIIGRLIRTGPIFDYRAALKAHALKNGTVISMEGTPLGTMRYNLAFDNAGRVIGSLINGDLVLDNTGKPLGMSGITASVMNGADKNFVSPFGYVFNSEGLLSGSVVKLSPLYNVSGAIIAHIMPDGVLYNKGAVALGKLMPSGINLDERNRVLGKAAGSSFAVDNNGNSLGLVSEQNLVLDKNKKAVAKILPDNSVVSADSNTSVNMMPQVGSGGVPSPVIGFNGSLVGYSDINGNVRDMAGAVIGRVLSDGLALDVNGAVIGKSIENTIAVDRKCALIGVVTPRGDVRNYRETLLGRPLTNGQVISETGNSIGYTVVPGSIIDANGNILGTVLPSGEITNYAGEKLGCVDIRGQMKSEGEIIGARVEFAPVMNFNDRIIGRTILDGTVVNDTNQFIGYMQPNGNVNSKTGVPIGHLFRYKFAFDNDNNLIGRVTSDAKVLNNKNEEIGEVDFTGYVKSKDENIGYALYDLYIYDKDFNAVGHIAKDGNIIDFGGKNIGRLDRGFWVQDGIVKGRGSRDYYIRTENNVVLGELALNGSLVNTRDEVIGSLKENGEIRDSNGNILAIARPLQYYSGKSLQDIEAERLAAEEAARLAAEEEAKNRGSWYNKGTSEVPQIGVVDSSELEKYRKSLGIALTPDGEYLGDILEDGRVVDKNGKVIGKKMPDGLIIDDDGSLIGIEEVKKPETQGMFVPPGTFGPGAAYGTGSGPGGNLGPGGGFGPGERYDPQRAAALAAAQNQRRQAMAVGKISSGIRKEAFDGYQENWDEQGIPKAVSSWRVRLNEMIFADKPIPAVIARSIDSNNPTPVTAYVERNVYAEEGRNVIIPAGSRLIGTLGGLTAGTEATSSSAKVQITWERLIRPDGSLFVFQGITADAQGRGGALGYLDQQLFKKYTLPIMTTALTSYTSYIMAPKDDDSNSETESPRQQAANDARQNFLQDMNRVFEQILADKTNIKPLTYVPAGTRIIVFPNIDLWLRTPERDEAEVAANMYRRDVLIDDKEIVQQREDTKNKRKMGMTDADRPSAAGSVVYEAQASDVEAVETPKLIEDKKGAAKKQPAAPSSPALLPTAPSGATPPPPPSFSSGSSSGSDTGNSSGKTDNSVPQLF